VTDDGLVLVETAAGVGEDELKEKTGVAFVRA
jgi:3-oxoacid CoA-transferase subunit B